MISRATGVLSCTANNVWVLDADTGLHARFCKTDDVTGGCLDDDPTVRCWSSEHGIYIALALSLLCPYYLAMLYFQNVNLEQQSAVVVHGGWCVISMQSKFFLGFVTSIFGSCHPAVILISVTAVLMSQLWLFHNGTVYSNVHSLNSIRFGGLLLALVNGAGAAYALWYYEDHAPCSVSRTDAVVGSTSGQLLRVASDYGNFIGLCAANISAIGIGACNFEISHISRYYAKWICLTRSTAQESIGTGSSKLNGRIRENGHPSTTMPLTLTAVLRPMSLLRTF